MVALAVLLFFLSPPDADLADLVEPRITRMARIRKGARVIGRKETASWRHLGHSLPETPVLSKPKLSDGCDWRLFQRDCP